MLTSLNCEQELQRAYEVIDRLSRTVEMLTGLLAQQDDDGDGDASAGYLNQRG